MEAIGGPAGRSGVDPVRFRVESFSRKSFSFMSLLPYLKLSRLTRQVCWIVVAGLFALSGIVQAASVDSKTAQTLASRWLARQPAPLHQRLGSQIGAALALRDAKEQSVGYVISLKPSGYVIVSADDQVEPIIAFSKRGSYDTNANNPLQSLVTADLPRRIAAAQTLKNTPLAGERLRVSQKWQRLSGTAIGKAQLEALNYSVSELRVAPFVESEWGQGESAGVAAFNYYTPPYATGNYNNYLAGCVATAMSQVMRYFQYPTSAVGSKAFTITVDYLPMTASLLGGNGRGGAYDWANMPLWIDDFTSTEEIQAIGALVYDAAVSVNMDFEYNGSGANTLDAAAALKSVFRYSNSIGGYPNGGTNLLPVMINPNIDARLPVILGIYSTSLAGGHAVVVDGYGYDSGTLYHHLNLGWEGYDDAWYALPTIDTTEGTFDIITKCIYNTYVTGTGEIISGRVLATDGTPISGATVTAKSSSGKFYATTTDDAGIYALAALPSSTSFTLKATMADYADTSISRTTGKSVTMSGVGNVWAADITMPVGIAPVVTTQPTNQAVVPGGQAVFKVAASGTATLTYQWFKDGAALTDLKNKIAGATTSTLKISSLQASNVGQYSVVITNSSGSVTSSIALLHVEPTVAIAQPTKTTLVLSSPLVATGAATNIGGVGIAQVLWKLNSGAYAPADGSNAWTVVIPVTNGVNTLSVKCVDLNGVESPVVSVKFTVRISSPITLSTNGFGKITGATNLQIIALGNTVTLKAAPATGQLFSNWNGTLNSAVNPLKFVMTQDLALTANFVPDPFPALAGSYNGLFEVADTVTHESSGFLTLSLLKSASFSGKLIGKGGSFSFSGKFNIDKSAQITVPRKGLSSLRLSMRLGESDHQLIGTVSDGVWTAGLTADLATFSAKNQATAYAGKYTLSFPGADESATLPKGDGWAAATITTAGGATLKGSLADGTVVNQTTPIAPDSRFPLYVSIASGKGSLFGWLSFNSNAAPTVKWFSPALATARYYPSGFQSELPVSISPFTYQKGRPLLNFATGSVALSGGNLSGDTNGVITLSTNNVVKSLLPLTNQLSLTFNTADGTVTGNYTDALTRRKNTLKGVILQNQTNASGYFLGTNLSGRFAIEPQ